MGIHIRLDIVPGGIDASRWARVYDQSLELFGALPLRLVALRYAEPQARRRRVYSSRLEIGDGEGDDRYWKLDGELTTADFIESFQLFRALSHYGVRGLQPPTALTEALRDEGPSHSISVFSAKTQGRTCHVPLLAVALMVEHEFPEFAFASGDFDLAQAEEARALVGTSLNKDVDLPVCIRPHVLLDRLSEVVPSSSLFEAAWRLFKGDPPILLQAIARRFDRQSLEGWYATWLGNSKSPRILGAYQAMSHWLRSTRDLDALARMGCLTDDGPRWDPPELAATLGASRTVVDDLKHYLAPPLEFAYAFVAPDVQRAPSFAAADPQVWPEAEEVLRVFCRLFPSAADEIREAVRERQAEITRGELDKGSEETWLPPPAFKHREQTADELLGSLPLLDGGRDLSDGELATRALAFAVGKMWDQVKENPDASHFLTEGPTALRCRIEKICAETHFVLLEESWEWLDRETDSDLLRAVFFLVLCHRVAPGLTHQRRMTLAHRSRCLQVLEVSQDADFCREMKSWVDKVKRSEGGL